MHRELIQKAFDKARNEAQNKGANKPSNNSLAKILSDFISNELNTPIGERRLRDYYNASIHASTTNDYDISITQINVVIGLCNYLGHENYQAFVLETNSDPKKKIVKNGVRIFTTAKIKPENRPEKDKLLKQIVL